MRNTGTPPRATMLARAALALYPPSWRARYGDEVRALLDESRGGVRTIASLAWRALPAWIWPPAHLYDRPARMRASLATGLVAWSFLTGLGLVFAQLTQFQGYQPDGHPVIAWSYPVFDAALALSVLAAEPARILAPLLTGHPGQEFLHRCAGPAHRRALAGRHDVTGPTS
jgi:hypothetical protein